MTVVEYVMSFFANWAEAANFVTKRHKKLKKISRTIGPFVILWGIKDLDNAYALGDRKTDSRGGQDVVDGGLGAAAGLEGTNKFFDFLI